MNTPYWLVIPAAGQGRRFGGGVPKQYLPLRGLTMLEHTIRAFADDSRCRGLAVALAPADAHWGAVRARLRRGLVIREAPGGAERADSVRSALAALEGLATATDQVLVHDAARPCVTRAEIDALLEADAPDGALLALPLADTLKRAQADATAPAGGAAGAAIAATAPREGLWRALTPQRFAYGLLCEALRSAAAAQRLPTDESQAVEWLGRHPRLVGGAATNLKITTAADLELAEAILAARDGGWGSRS